MSFKFVDLDQNSEEWHKWRRFKIGASDIAAIMGDSPYKSALQLWEEKTWGNKTIDNEGMKKGRENEPIARQWVNDTLHCNFKPFCIESVNQPHLIASLDGYDPDNSYNLLEIKYMNRDMFQDALSGIIRIDYQWQVQAQMYILNLDSALICACHENKKHLIEVTSDVPMWQRIHDDTKPFYDRVLNFEAPEPCDRDIQTITNSIILAHMDEYIILENAVKSSQERMKKLKDQITQGLEKCGIKRANIGPKRVSLIPMKGRVDYDIIPELKGVDLNRFRSAPTNQWRVMSYSSD